MTTFRGEDLSGARFERVDLTGALFRTVDLTNAQFRAVDLIGVAMRGVEMMNVEISGDLESVTINGSTSRPLSVPSSTGGTPTGSRFARTTQPASARHGTSSRDSGPARSSALDCSTPRSCMSLSKASGRSPRRCATWPSPPMRGSAEPSSVTHRRGTHWTCRGTRWPIPRACRATVRHGRRSTRFWRFAARGGDRWRGDRAADRRVADRAHRPGGGAGWPRPVSYSVRECLLVILNEEWEHRLYAERDLTLLVNRT
jgi:hypothetical protein